MCCCGGRNAGCDPGAAGWSAGLLKGGCGFGNAIEVGGHSRHDLGLGLRGSSFRVIDSADGGKRLGCHDPEVPRSVREAVPTWGIRRRGWSLPQAPVPLRVAIWLVAKRESWPSGIGPRRAHGLLRLVLIHSVYCVQGAVTEAHGSSGGEMNERLRNVRIHSPGQGCS